MTTDTKHEDFQWAARWAAQAVALLKAQQRVETTGELPADAAVASAFEDGSYDDIVASHFRQLLEGSQLRYKEATRLAMDALLSAQDLDGANRLGEVLHEQATTGWWLQQVSLGQSLCGALEGESTLFGFGVFMDRGQDTVCPSLATSEHLDHLKALLLSDYQLANAFRVVLFPVLLGTAQTAALSAWQVGFLRTQLEAWAEANLEGHPDVATANQWLATAGVDFGPVKYSDLVGRETQPGEGMSLMDAYTVLGLVMHSPQDPVSQECLTEEGPLSSILFPRSQCAEVQSYLESEQKHIQDALGSGALHGEELEELKTALVRCEGELRELRAVYGACLLPPQDAQAARPDGASTLVHQFLFQALAPRPPRFLMVVASASGFYDSLKPTRDALRYMRLRTMLNHAGGRVGLENSAGLQAEVLLDGENHQVVVHTYHPSTGMYAGMALWPLHAWETAAEFMGRLNRALEEAGVARTVGTTAATGGVH